MAGHDIVVIGASAGGVEALKLLVSHLPADLPASVFVVLHVPSHGTSVLPNILSRNGALPAVHAKDGQEFQPGHIYIAPPDHHLLIKRGYVKVARGPRENGHRPAVDPLFRSAARYYGKRVVGVVLSGVLDDGTAGLIAVHMRGGVCVAQDPKDAMYDGMPLSAIEHDHVTYILPVPQIASKIAELANTAVSESSETMAEDMEREIDMAELDNSVQAVPPGTPTVWACPDCGGTLWELQEGDLLRFRCRVGHAFSAQSLLFEQSEQLEEAFWVALRALEESAALARRMAGRARERNQTHSIEQFEDQARSAEQNAKVIRDVLQKGIMRFQVGPTETPGED